MLDILTDDEKAALTGYRRPTYQARWLRDNGIRHWIRRDGEVVVPASAVNETRQERPEPKPEPNLEGLASGGA